MKSLVSYIDITVINIDTRGLKAEYFTTKTISFRYDKNGLVCSFPFFIDSVWANINLVREFE